METFIIFGESLLYNGNYLEYTSSTLSGKNTAILKFNELYIILSKSVKRGDSCFTTYGNRKTISESWCLKSIFIINSIYQPP